MDQCDLGAIGFMFDAQHEKTIRNFTFPSNQVSLQMLVIDDDPGHLQSGLYIWPATTIAAQHLSDISMQQNMSSVLELGSGCGVAGIYSSTLPSVNTVVLTDYDPGCIQLLQQNLELNSISYLEAMSKCHVMEYTWGTTNHTLLQLTNSNSNNSNNINTHIGYDIIIGADLLYSIDIVSPLILSVSLLLNHQHGLFLLVSSFDIGELIENEIQSCMKKHNLISQEVQSLDMSKKQCRIQHIRFMDNNNVKI